ncbi:Phenazine biosynthesis protein PhzF like [Actinomycetales bacterium JB111]|nr:Phenazine biosynthesis protein PhzF like [Actinomycetales bacterium JB111]
MPRTRPFAQVDVFSATPYGGNPVAVVLDAEGIEESDMARIARWTNLSETTFVLPPASPDADYRLRIFTPTGELPFAGHPTLGSARAWLTAGGAPAREGALVQECGAGLVTLRQDGDALFFAAPPTIRSGDLPPEYLDHLVTGLGIGTGGVGQGAIGSQWVDNGPGWAVVEVASAAEVLALTPDLARIPDAKVGVIGAYPEGAECAFEIRAFAPGVGVAEDPVTGSLNASVAQWMIAAGRAPSRYTVAQGTALGRSGRVRIEAADGEVWVGGGTTVCFTGTAWA